MPYLHWESSSRCVKMVQVINEEIANKKQLKPQMTRPRQTFFHAVEQHKLKSKYTFLPPARSKALGPYLMSVAKIADEMDVESDERLLRDYLLDGSAPLHPRRTLDQSYFL